MAEKKNWRDAYKDDNANSGKAGSWRSAYEDDTFAAAGANIADRVNTFLKNHNTYINNYRYRTYGRKYDYSDDYVRDPNDWLMKVSNQKKAFDTEANNILAYMDRYKDYLDAEWMKSVQDALSGARAEQDIVVGNASADSKWWSNFANEDEYKTAQRYDGYNKKYSGMSGEEIRDAWLSLADGEEKSWLSSSSGRLERERLSSSVDDFNEKSKYVNNVVYGLLGKPEFTDDTYAYVNNPVVEDKRWLGMGEATARELIESDRSAYAWDTPGRNNESTFNRANLERMNEDEVAIYNYYYATEGAEKANEYLDYIARTLDYRQNEELIRSVSETSKDHPFLSSLASIGTSLGSGFEHIGNLIEYGTDKLAGKDAFIRRNQNASATSAVRGTVSEMVDWEIGNFDAFDFVYNTAMSGADSVASMAFGGLGGTVLGLSAAASATNDALSRGMSDKKAFWNGLASGVAEGLFETWSISKFKALKEIEPETVKDIFKNIGKSMLTNASEEFFTEIANIGYDTLVNGEFANITLEELGNGGWSKVFAQALEAAASGALMGIGMGGAASTHSYFKANSTALNLYGENTDDLIQEGLESDQNSESYRLAQKFQQQVHGYTDNNGKQVEGKALSGNQIRNLVKANDEQIFKETRNEAKDKLKALGENASEVWPIAELVAKKVTGRELTRAEKRKLVNSFGSQVAHDMENPTVETQSGTRAYNATYKSITERTGEKRQYNVAEDGKATVQESGNAFDLSKAAVTDIKKDKRTGKVTDVTFMADGKEVQASGIQFADESQSFLVEAVSNMENITPKDATALIHDVVDTSKPLGEQLNGIDQAFNYGFWDYSVNDLQAGEFVGSLSTQQMMSAYELGKAARRDSNLAKDAPVVKMRTALEAQMSAEQKAAQQKANFESDDVQVYFLDKNSGAATKFDGNIDKYEGNKAATIRATQILSKMRIGGSGYYLYESYVGEDGVRYYKDENGVEKKAPNGLYRETDGRIYIDLNAGEHGQGVGLFTLSHELTHFVKHRSEAQFKKLGDLVTEAFGKTDKSMDQRVLEKQAELKEARGGKDVSYADAYEEVVCDALSTMISDGNFFKKVAKIKVEDKGLFNTMKRFFRKMFAKFKAVYEKLTPDQQDAIDIRQMKDMFDRIQTAFAEAVVEASDNFHAAMESVVETNAEAISADETLTEGAVVTDGEGERFSIRSMKHDIAEGKMFEDLKKVCGWTDAQVNVLRNQLNDLVEYMIPYRNILDMNETYGREGRRFSPYKPNSDPLYKISMDFSTLCSKRLLTQYVIEQLQLREKRPMSAEEQMAIRDMLNEYRKVEKGLQVACAMCYVEAARLKSPKQVQRWLDDPTPHLINYFALKNTEFNASVKNAQADFKESKGYDRNAPKKDMKQADVTALNKIGPKMRSQYQPSAAEQAIIDRAKTLPNETYLTAGNLADLSEKESVIYDAYTSFVRTATRSKSLESDEPYYYGDSTRDNGNGIIVTDSFIEAVNRENGMRFSSWSDWRIQHLLDYITAVIDNSVRGAAMHGYTKFGDEVRVLGKTGMMFNMSGVAGTQTGLNEDGSLNFSPTESIDVNEAIQLREEYPDTAGLQCIGVSNEHIVALLRSDIIDYVIPYHVSGLNKALRTMAKIQGWDDYTGTQNASIDKSIKFENAVDQEHWHEEPVYSEFFVGYDTGMTGIEAMRASAEKYKQMCKDRGLTPKFNQFANEKNYWKLLIDRKMINQKTGKLIQQRAVTPTFDFDVIKSVVDKFVDNYDAGLEARALNHIVENWDSIPQRIKDLKKQGGTKAKKTKQAAATLANQTVAAQVKESSRTRQTMRDIDIDRTFINYGDTVAEQAAIDAVVASLVSREKFVNINRDNVKKHGTNGKWVDWQAARDYLKGILEKFMGGSVYFAHNKQYAEAYLTRAGVDHSAGGVITAERAEIFDQFKKLVQNAEYAFSSKNDIHSESNKKISGKIDWDCFVAVAKIGEEPYPVVFKIRTIDRDVRSQIHEMSMKKEADGSHDPGQQNEPLGGMSTYGVAPSTSGDKVTQPKPEVNKNSDKNSERVTAQQDRDYLAAVKNGDMETAQRMVDEAAKEAGYTIKAYHGTPIKGLTVFDNAKIGSTTDDGIFGHGFYFTTNKNTADGYATVDGETMTVLLRVEKPWWGLGHNINEVAEELGLSQGMLTTRKVGRRSSVVAPFTKYSRTFTSHLIENGYDSVIVQHGKRDYEVVVFDNTKIKSADPVTYDADGKVIPLSQRFNEENDDIRYSERVKVNTEGMDENAKAIIKKLEIRAIESRYRKGVYASYSAERIERELYNSSSATQMDYAKSYIAWVDADEFLNATTYSQDGRDQIEQEAGELDLERLRNQTQPIHLTVDFETGKIVGHEGRHRMTALRNAGVEKVAVIFDAWNDDRHNTKPVDMMRIEGQEFDRYHIGLGFYVHDMLPLSKRYADAAKKLFSEVNGSIKFSERTGHSVSNRALLANAFEGLSQNSNEYKLIQQYKGHIAELNSLEDKLSEFRHEIRKLRFGKDEERDAQKLARLESEAKKIAEAINKHDKEILSLEASEPLRKVIEHERKKESEKTKAHVKEIQQNKKVRAEQAELRHKIRKTIRDLDKILNRGNKKTNVKEDMKDFASKALELADYLFTDHISNDELIRRGIDENLMRGNEAQLVKETEEILSKLYDNADSLTDEEFTRLDEKRKVNEYKLRDLLTKQRNERLNTPVYNLFNDLVTEYAKLKNSKQDAVRAAYNVDLERLLRQFMGDSADGADTDRKTILQNMRVADMTTEELNKLYEAYKMVLTNIRDANKIHVIGKFASIDKMAEAITWDFSKRKIPDGKAAIIARNIANKLGWDYEKLYYALDRIGSEAFTELVMNIANSENIVMQDVMEAKAFLDEMVKQYGFNNWDVNKEIDREFLDNTGKKFKLTLGQMMSLYAYSRRKGAWDHIEYGGFVFGEAALTNPRPADSYKLSKAQCEAITSLLTEQQKGYVEAMQKFLSETMGAKGNEVSMMLYGIKMFGEKNYFPIHIAGQFKAQANESQAKQAAGFSSMSNAGFTHAQNPNAKAPFVLEGFNEVWVDHVNEMSRYHGTVPALEDMRRVMNRSSYSEATAESMAIKQLMENSYGKEAVEYFDNLYREANSGAITDKLEKNSKRLVSLFRKNSVAYSLSVLVQQPASITRAYAMIDKKYFGFKGFGTITSGIANVVTDKWTKAHTDTYNKMLKYAPGVTRAKEIGGFDTATGGSIRSYLLDTNKSLKQKWKTGTALEKGKAVMDLVDDNAIANLPNVADKIAWCEIWNACERETVAKHKDLKPGSDEFLKAVGERFTEVIRATQVYDSIFAKSPMLKNKRIYVQMLTSFMNEPNTVANMAESAVRDFVRGSKKVGVKKAAVLIHGIIFTGVLKSIVYAMRDDDEDETYIEKYIESLAGSLMADFNALNYIPLARDVVSLAQGYDVERADMAIVADAVDALGKVIKNGFTETEDMTEEQLIEFDKKCTEANWKLVESLASFFGIPVKNIRREIVGVLDHARIASANRGKTTGTSTWDKIYDTVTESIPFMQTKSKHDKLYEAIISGDKEYLNRLKSGYKDESAYHTAVRKALRDNDSRVKEAAQAHINGDPYKRVRIAKQIVADGFDLNDVILAINAEIDKLTPDKESSETAKVKGYYKAEDFVREAANGDTESLGAIREDILKTAQANGKTADEAEEDFISDIKSEAKDAYFAGTLGDAKAAEILVRYAELDDEEADSKVNYWSFIKAHPQYRDDLTQSSVEKYREFAEPAEIPLDVFVQYLNGTKGLAKREQVLEVIDSLPLTWQQKDALYLAAGYSEDNIWDVPW